MKKTSISLSDTQLSIMRALWRHGEADTQTVCDALAAERRELAYTTVATLLKRLEKRELVAHRKEGRKQVFRACVSEAEVRNSMVSEFVGGLFRGDTSALVSHLIRQHDVTREELDEIELLIARERDHES